MEMESLTKAASTEDTSQEEEEEVESKSELRKSTLVTLESAFQAVDISVKSNLAQEEEEEQLQFTVKRPRGSGRTRSYSLTSNTLPEQQVRKGCNKN